MNQLEYEKNALLDYIENNVEKSQKESEKSFRDKTLESEKIKQLEFEKSKLYQMSENLKY